MSPLDIDEYIARGGFEALKRRLRRKVVKRLSIRFYGVVFVDGAAAVS